MMYVLWLPLALAQAPPPGGPPAGPPAEPLPNVPAEPPLPPPGPAPADPKSVPSISGITFQLVETNGDAPLPRPIVTVAVGAEAATPYPLADDGHSGGDPVAGDGHWATHVDAPLGQAVTFAVYSSAVNGEPLFSATSTIPAGTANAEVRVIHDAVGIHLDETTVTGGQPGSLGVPGGGPSARAAAVPAGVGAAAPTSPAIGLRTWLAGAAAALVALGSGFASASILERRRVRISPLQHQRALPFGLDARVALALMFETADAEPGFRAALCAFCRVGPVLVLPRPETRAALAADGILGVWQFGKERPDGVDAVRAALQNGFSIVVVEGAEALEAPVSGEAGSVVMDELVTHGKIALVFVLRAGEPVPTGARRVAMRRDVDAFVGEGIRIEGA